MVMRGRVFVVLCMILFHVLMPRGSAGRQGAASLFLGLADHSIAASPDIDEGMMEQMWVNCTLDLMGLKENIKDSDLYLLEEIIHERKRLLAKGSTQEVIALLSPEIKSTFLDCLSKKNFPFRVSGKDGGRYSFGEFVESLLGWHPAWRRHLANQAIQTVSPSLSSSPALAPDVPWAPSASPGINPPSYGPSPSSVPAPASAPDLYYISPSPTPSSSYAPEHMPSSPNDSRVLPSKKQKETNRSVIIAAVTIAVGASLLAAFLACCLCCRKKNYSGHDRKDSRHLLSLSDLSGSSEKSFGLENSSNNNKFGTSSFKNDPNRVGHVSTVDIISVQDLPSAVLPGVSKSLTDPFNESNNAPAPNPPPPPMMPPPGPPPPPPKGGFIPRPPQMNSRVKQPSNLKPKQLGKTGSSQELDMNVETNAPRPKLKPFFWDKVLANSDQSMVWDQIQSGSFQFNEEMIESLFGYTTVDKNKSDGKKEFLFNDPSIQYVRILDPKKSQNLAISIKALNVKTEEVCVALMEGDELPIELLQTLLRMAPSTDEELKLRLYSDDYSLLGPAEKFLRALVDIPFAFQRMDMLLFMASQPEEILSTTESFSTLELACKELRSSRVFLKLLEAVLKTGNRMNDGTFRGGAQAFKLDTLLKLDVKGTDGKTTLLHFVVREVIRSEGIRAARLARETGSSCSLNSDEPTDEASAAESEDHFRSHGLRAVSGLSGELDNVKKAAGLDSDVLSGTLASLGHRLVQAKEVLDRSSEEESGFSRSLESFVQKAEADITSLLEEEKRVRALVKSTADYFHGNEGKDEGFRLFVVVRDFLVMLDKACREVGLPEKRASRLAPPRRLIHPAIRGRRVDSDSSSSGDEST